MAVDSSILNKDVKFRYQLLDRMSQDISYCRGFIERSEEDKTGDEAWNFFLDNHLWGGTEEHFSTMEKLLKSFEEDEMPEWYSLQKLQTDKQTLEELAGRELG